MPEGCLSLEYVTEEYSFRPFGKTSLCRHEKYSELRVPLFSILNKVHVCVALSVNDRLLPCIKFATMHDGLALMLCWCGH